MARGRDSPFADYRFPEKQVEAILGMSTRLPEGFVPENERRFATTTATTLAAWACEHLGPARAEAESEAEWTSPARWTRDGQSARKISVRLAGAPSTGAGSSGIGATPPAAIRSTVPSPSGRTRPKIV